MSGQKSKREILKEARAWNRQAARVRADIFKSHAFFDPEDKVQVKYEMLRAREVDGGLLTCACSRFGFSRETYRHVVERFRLEGMAGLFGHKRGRKGPVKATRQVREFIHSEHSRERDLTPEELAQRCYQEFGIAISRRTVFRILAQTEGNKKKR